MKKNISILGLILIAITAITLTSFQQEKGKKGQQQEKNKSAKQEKGNKGKSEMKGNNNQQGNNKGEHSEYDENGKDNNGHKMGNGMNKGPEKRKYKGEEYGYYWTVENFNDRKKFKNNEKVLICHKFNNGNQPGVTIKVSSNAIKAHMNHGDVMGDCPPFSNTNYSNYYLDNRRDYYNTIEAGRDQVYYSQSILEYALERLTGSRQQLVTMQNNNLPVVEIERKQETIVVLERNVSLLESLINVAANVIVDKLQ